MLSFVIRRVLVSIPLVVLASIVAFILVVNTGDPIEDLRTKPNVPKATIALREHELGLDKPVVERYVAWLGKAVHGDFGKTIKNRPVWARSVEPLVSLSVSCSSPRSSRYCSAS